MSLFQFGKLNLFFFLDWGLSSELFTSKADATKQVLSPFYFGYFWRWGSHELFA
jgi:hypothetical protein